MNWTGQREPLAIGSGGTDARMPNRASRPWIAPLVWQIAPPQEGFILTPEQHRRRAQDMRGAGRPRPRAAP
jgi:hypothetical protein